MSFIVAKDIKKYYGDKTSLVKALDGINFEIENGELVVILGASGAGKSTMLNILGGMDHPTSGEYIVDDVDVTSLSEKDLALFRRYDIGFVFQFYNLMPNLTALENIELAESVAKNPMKSFDALKMVGLEHRRNNFPSELSGGEQQRISIARALVKKPKILLCDEPTGALDSKTGRLVLEQILQINKNEKKTVIIVTHNASISLIANRVIKMKDGQIISNDVQTPKGIEDITW